MKKDNHLFLVDGSSCIFRAYHALPPLTRQSDGLPVGAVAGYCSMIWKLLRDARDMSPGITHFAVIFDHSSKTFRNEIYPEYKANRQEPPEDLRPQFGLIRKATRAFNLPCIEAEGFEADDLIAAYARHAQKAGATVTIVSSDKDLMQLIDERIVMYDQMKNHRIGPNEVVEKFGVAPEKMVDLQALAGDSTDNVPGIPGIGPKTAALLLNEYGSLETLLERAGEIKQKKRRENLIEFADLARISKRLVTLDSDMEPDVPVNDFILQPMDGAKLIAFLKAMEFKTLTGKVATDTQTCAELVEADVIVVEGYSPLSSFNTDTREKADIFSGGLTPGEFARHAEDLVSSDTIDVSVYECIRDRKRLAQWISKIREEGLVAIDTETSSLDPMQAELVGISLATQPETACYIPLTHKSSRGDLLGNQHIEKQLSTQEALNLLKPVLEDPSILKIGHNIKYDWLVFFQHGIELTTLDDTMLLSYTLDAGQGKHGLNELARKWLGHDCLSYKELTGTGKNRITFDFVDIDRAAIYAAEDADVALRLWKILKPRLVAEGMACVYERLERPLIEVIARMEARGVLVDRWKLSRLSGELGQIAIELEGEIHKLAGEHFNIASPRQIAEILFDKLNLPGGRKTRTGQYSTSMQILDELAMEGHEIPKKILIWRQLTKLKSTYADALPEFINPDTGRVHTSYSMASTSTGRLSSSNPNLQNIPVRTEEGRKIRSAFIADKNNQLLSADYSQIELRALAYIADIDQLKQAFHDNRDIHAMTASEMFGIPLEDMDPMTRRRAKAINFGIIYGISAFGLANQLDISRGEASNYIKTYFERFPGIQKYMEKTKKFAREHGYVKTVFGRKAHYPEINSPNPQVRAFNERAAINAPIQGTAADIIRRAMTKMDRIIKKSGLSAHMLLQVHDELIFELPREETEATIPVIKKVMENAAFPALDLKVKLKVDAQIADNWNDAH